MNSFETPKIPYLECYCDWDGSIRDCKTEKCKRNGRECNLGSTCDFDEGERCFCDWNGEIKYV